METKDSLTGLYDKWSFFFQVQELLKQPKEEKYQLLYSDIKSFKLVNDLFGFAAGDRMICQIAEALRELPCKGAVYARLEADRFGIFTPERYASDMIHLLTEREFLVEVGNPYIVHIDVGIYEIDDKTISVSLMCDRAKMALDTIKEDQSKHVAYFKETMREQMLKEQMLYGELHRAIKNREMTIYLQGLFDAEETIVGAEALVRWNHPTKGVLTAGSFVETLEKNGLIVILDQYIWELACEQLKKWELEGKSNIALSVNISAKDFETINVCEVLTGLVKKHKILPEKLRLEITETALMQDIESNLKIVDALRENGFIVEIDDFGSGYSSLNMLKDITADVIKLDMKFLQKCKDEQRSKTILQAMVKLMKQLGMQVVVEGVETREQFELLKEYQCDLFQGYYLMRPQPVAGFEKNCFGC
ncbi:MAG: bifunctional diguanylate cyclase/phosphodiesterase [Lachnospiraceae bacterium]|nr:bifunctional diguanylate cyclase/phosphodiesterase [Lachnospiraceae bacterium]